MRLKSLLRLPACQILSVALDLSIITAWIPVESPRISIRYKHENIHSQIGKPETILGIGKKVTFP